jgi:flavin-dependent dehydrogenase
VLIFGGGVAGPALALFPKKAGISSAVYESHPYTEGVGGGPIRQRVRERFIALFVRLSGDRYDRWLYEYSIG